MNADGYELRPNTNEVRRIGRCGERDNRYRVVFRKGLVKTPSSRTWPTLEEARREADGKL